MLHCCSAMLHLSTLLNGTFISIQCKQDARKYAGYGSGSCISNNIFTDSIYLRDNLQPRYAFVYVLPSVI